MAPSRAQADGASAARAIASLGFLTIVAYGSWYYGFGVLLDPIHQSDHWSRGALGAVFGATILVNGIGAALGGRLLDAGGPRRTFLLAALLGAGGLLVASEQHTLVGFAVAYAIGGGSIGALGFYHVTQAAAARTTPARSSQAISRLTIIGAFASPIFLPLTAWLVDQTDWRVALRVDAVAFLFAAAVVPDHRIPDAPRGRALDAFRAAWLAAANLRAAFAALLLLASGALPIAVSYRLLAGAATGASSPLQGIYTAELVEDHDLGLLLGYSRHLRRRRRRRRGPGRRRACRYRLVGPAIVLTALGFAGAAFMLRGGDASSSGCYEAALIAPTGGLACCAPSALASSATASGTRR